MTRNGMNKIPENWQCIFSSIFPKQYYSLIDYLPSLTTHFSSKGLLVVRDFGKSAFYTISFFRDVNHFLVHCSKCTRNLIVENSSKSYSHFQYFQCRWYTKKISKRMCPWSFLNFKTRTDAIQSKREEKLQILLFISKLSNQDDRMNMSEA